tara:strand:- start:389 stop:1270 length:882 start_codon:yes stop_codon:yes gene_type:complete
LTIVEVKRQKTLKTQIGCSGIALHSGSQTTLTLKPAKPGFGVRINRTDLVNGAREILVSWRNVVDTSLATTIGNNHGTKVGTIEHLMAALAGCEIDNVLIEVNGPEIPIMDGSAAPFVFLIENAGIEIQDAPRSAIKILKPIKVIDGKRSLSVSPSTHFRINFEIDFTSTIISCQKGELSRLGHTFKTEISRARTFGFEKDVDELRNAGLALGGSLENAVVISDDKILNEEGLRYDDEFVRHKILDCIGDLYLAGAPIIGHVNANLSGHELNNKLLHAVFADDSAWCSVTPSV